MDRSLRWLLFLTLAIVAVSLGCSQEPVAPTQQHLSLQAPLFNSNPNSKYVSDGYIVVFKDNVPDVTASVGELGKRHGFKADFSYAHAIKGFAGKLNPAVVEALRLDP